MTVPNEVSIKLLKGDGVTDFYQQDFCTGSPESTFICEPISLDQPPLTFGVEYVEWDTDLQSCSIKFNIAPPNDVEFLLARSTPNYQDSSYSPYGPFPAQQAEADWDKNIRILQEMQDAQVVGGSGSIASLKNYVDIQDAALSQRIDDISAAQGVLARGALIISFDAPEGIPEEKSEWVQIGNVGVGIDSGDPVDPEMRGTFNRGRKYGQ